jgi:alpha-1,2-mannosyltransferase
VRHQSLIESSRAIQPRWLRTILWGLGAISFGVTMAKAIDLGLSTHQVDFDVYLMGAKQVFTGHLYTSYLVFPRLPFTYPPISTLLFIPFTLMSRVGAQVTWAALSTILLVGFLYCSLGTVRPSWRRPDLVLWSLLLTLPAMLLNPIGMTFSFGQINILLALLVLTDLTKNHFVKKHAVQIPQGVMTGIAAALKLTPLIFVPFLFATKQIRAGCVALITFSICGLVMLIATPSETWSYWTKYVFDAHRVGGVVYISNQSLRSTIYRFSHGHAPESLLVVLVLLVGSIGLSTAVWAYRSSSALLGILLCAVTGLLVSPITWAHHLVWIVPIVLWLALAPDRPAFGRIWAILAAGWFWSAAIWRVPHGSGVELHDSFTQLLIGNSYTIAMVVFVGGMAVMLTLRHQRTSDAPDALMGPGGGQLHVSGRTDPLQTTTPAAITRPLTEPALYQVSLVGGRKLAEGQWRARQGTPRSVRAIRGTAEFTRFACRSTTRHLGPDLSGKIGLALSPEPGAPNTDAAATIFRPQEATAT